MGFNSGFKGLKWEGSFQTIRFEQGERYGGKGKGRGKVHPITGHEGPGGE
jgi:hypothetical protein